MTARGRFTRLLKIPDIWIETAYPVWNASKRVPETNWPYNHLDNVMCRASCGDVRFRPTQDLEVDEFRREKIEDIFLRALSTRPATVRPE